MLWTICPGLDPKPGLYIHNQRHWPPHHEGSRIVSSGIHSSVLYFRVPFHLSLLQYVIHICRITGWCRSPLWLHCIHSQSTITFLSFFFFLISHSSHNNFFFPNLLHGICRSHTQNRVARAVFSKQRCHHTPPYIWNQQQHWKHLLKTLACWVDSHERIGIPISHINHIEKNVGCLRNWGHLYMKKDIVKNQERWNLGKAELVRKPWVQEVMSLFTLLHILLKNLLLLTNHVHLSYVSLFWWYAGLFPFSFHFTLVFEASILYLLSIQFKSSFHPY